MIGEVLSIKQVSIHESVFDLGADSLHMFQIVARCRQARHEIVAQANPHASHSGGDLRRSGSAGERVAGQRHAVDPGSPRALSRSPNQFGIAVSHQDSNLNSGDKITTMTLVEPSTSEATANPWGGEVHVFPTTLAQWRFCLLDRQDPGSPAYNLAIRFRLRGPLNHAAMAQAFNEILRRHESLRTVFAFDDGIPVQVVAPAVTIDVPVVDLAALSEEERLERAEKLASEEAGRRFNIAKGPLFRAVLLRLADSDHMLLITLHQTVSDCWSTGILTHELGPLYAAACQNTASGLPELPIQYGDYAVWQEQILEHDRSFDDQLAYWRGKLAELPALEIPPDKPRRAKKTSSGDIRSVVLPRMMTEHLKHLAHREGCTFFMLSLAALKVLIQRHALRNDIYVGTMTAGRSRVEMEPLIGRFINPLIIRSNLSDVPTFRTHLGRVRDTVLESLENRDVPYEQVAQMLRSRRIPAGIRCFRLTSCINGLFSSRWTWRA